MHAHGTMEAEALVRDAVCGMTVDPEAGKPRHAHGGRTFHFCSEGCRTKFAADPAHYIEATDPVCGMKVDRASARHMASHAGERLYFCSAGKSYVLQAGPKFQVLAVNDLGDVSNASPAVADGKLFLKGRTYLYCVGHK